MKYAIIQDPDPEAVAKEVCRMLDEGWMPVGGVSVALSTYTEQEFVNCAGSGDPMEYETKVVGTRIFAQAMVLPDKPEKQGKTERRILTGQFQS